MALKLAGKAHPETVTLFQSEHADSHRNQPDAVSCLEDCPREGEGSTESLTTIKLFSFLFPTLNLISNM